MAFTQKLPEWNATGVEPSETQKQTGFQPGVRPPAQWFNWHLNWSYLALKELQEKAAEKSYVDAELETIQTEIQQLQEDVQNADIPDASLTVKGKVQLSDLINDTSKDKAATPSAVKQAYDLANGKQSAIKLANNFAAPDAAITVYPEGISVFYVGGGTGGQGSAWKTSTGANESFGYVETVRIGTGGYQTFTEMYSGTDPANQAYNKQYKRNKRDSNATWQPFERVLDADDYNTLQAGINDSKQLGVEQKANVVAALNSIGVSASTSETWAQLISKMSSVIRATGNAAESQVLSGAIFSNAAGNNRVGTMPNRSAQSAHQLSKLTEVWQGDRVFFMPPDGYFDGQSWVYALTPDLRPENLARGKNVLGVSGNLIPSAGALVINIDGGGVVNRTTTAGEVIFRPFLSIPGGWSYLNVFVEQNSISYLTSTSQPGNICVAMRDDQGNTYPLTQTYNIFTYTNYILFDYIMDKSNPASRKFYRRGSTSGTIIYVGDIPSSFNLDGDIKIGTLVNATGAGKYSESTNKISYVKG